MGKLNMSAMQERLDAAGQNYQNTDYDKLASGKNLRRILWPKGDKDSFYSEGWIHFSLGADGKQVVTCPKTFSQKNPCPVCEYVERLQKSKSKDDKKLADDIKAKKRIYINVINRDSDDEDDTPKVLPIGVQILKGLLEVICDPEYGDITDPETGTDVTITKKGQGINTEYSVLPKKRESVVSETATVEELEEAMADLDSLFIEKSYDELEAILNGEDIPDEEDSEDEDEDDESDNYDEMDMDELEALCKERGIKITGKATRIKYISALTKYDETTDEADEGDEEDSEDEDDEVGSEIAAALARRKNKNKK